MKRDSTRRTANPTRYAREMGKRLPRWREKLAQYESEGRESAGGYYVHFSNYPKTGVYPTNRYDTPTGFYAYPLSFDDIADFAIDRPYAIIFEPVRARLWILANYTAADYARDLKILHDALGSFQATEWKKEARVQTPAGQMWNITRMLAKGNVARWTRIIYTVLGYDGVVDDCLSIIHTSERCQAVFFDMRTGSSRSPQNEKVRIVDVLEKGPSTRLVALKGISLRGRDLSRVRLRGMNLIGADFTDANLTARDLSGMDLRGATFRHAFLERANLSGANLRAANLTDANFSDADLTGANLTGANLTDSDLTGANLTRANLTSSLLIKVYFTRADLRGAILTTAGLSSANLRGADLRGAILIDASLRGADLRDAILSGADLSGADLYKADLTYADLTTANLDGADVRNANFFGAIWDATTTWPAGFKPKT